VDFTINLLTVLPEQKTKGMKINEVDQPLATVLLFLTFLTYRMVCMFGLLEIIRIYLLLMSYSFGQLLRNTLT